MDLHGGCEWVVEAHGCDRAALQDPVCLQALFAQMIGDLSLRPVADAQWHKFPGEGGVTGVTMLAESHLACHTFPEFGSLCLNLFCCRERPGWDFEAELRRQFGATQVNIRRIDRPYHE